MDARDLFLDQHAVVHSAAVGGNKASAAERAFAGVTDDQMRVRPREDLNSVAWLMWHIARAEDIIVNPVLAGRAQVLDDAWVRRLGIARRDFGIGMTSAEVTELTRRSTSAPSASTATPWGAARARSSPAFKPEDWEGAVRGGRATVSASLPRGPSAPLGEPMV